MSSFADMGQAFGFLGDLFLFMDDTVRAHVSSVRISPVRVRICARPKAAPVSKGELHPLPAPPPAACCETKETIQTFSQPI